MSDKHEFSSDELSVLREASDLQARLGNVVGRKAALLEEMKQLQTEACSTGTQADIEKLKKGNVDICKKWDHVEAEFQRLVPGVEKIEAKANGVLAKYGLTLEDIGQLIDQKKGEGKSAIQN